MRLPHHISRTTRRSLHPSINFIFDSNSHHPFTWDWSPCTCLQLHTHSLSHKRHSHQLFSVKPWLATVIISERFPVILPISVYLHRGVETCIKKTKHLTLKYCIGAWLVLPKARDLWHLKLNLPENHVTASISASKEATLSAVSFTLYYIIMRLHGFLFILIYILRSNELCPWNNSLRTEAELTLTDHRFNSWVYVWFIWIILVAVHRHKLMILTMAIIFIQ